MVLSTRSPIAIAACSMELPASVPTDILLIPAGEFRARDGRPQGLPGWRLTQESAPRVIAKAESMAGDCVIDYEHQTLHSEANGQPAPAAGWFKALTWREDGLHAEVAWTAKAKAAIEAGEYRYISPVFDYDKRTGEVLTVLMAALTNYPALDGHSDLAARAAAKFQPQTEDEIMKKKLITLLALADDAGDEQIEQAVAALKTKAAAAEGKDAEIAALKARTPAAPDPAQFVPIATFEALKGEVAALKNTQQAGEVDTLISQGIKDGKLLPVQETWARELGTANLAALKGYLEKTPVIAGLGGTQTGGRAPESTGQDGLTSAELAVCKNLGITAEEYKKTNPAA